ncbi:MAG: hypothetical protein RL113_320 [Pseudomonadota bacterium]|jgi:hypothetical protein
MTLKNFLWDYGVKVPGYEVGVLNEREVSAAAGILGFTGLMVLFIAIGFNHPIVAKTYLSFLFIDFMIRIINPQYAPSMLMGKFMTQNHKPEYVGALQKRFAWTLGIVILMPAMYWFVFNWDISFYKVMICVLCLILTFMESVFSICVGCWMYSFITKENAQYCAGDKCEVRIKEPIQTFNLTQKIITGMTFLFFALGIYSFLAYSQPRTFFGEFLHELVLTDTQLEAEQQAIFDKEWEEEEGDDEEE